MVKRAQGNFPRKIAIYFAAELSGKKFDLIAAFFKKISVTGISQAILRINRLKITDPSISRDIINLLKLIQK